MLLGSGNRGCVPWLMGILLATLAAGAVSAATWQGVLSDDAGKPVAGAIVKLHSGDAQDYTAKTARDGKYGFAGIAAGRYEVSVRIADKEWKAGAALAVGENATLTRGLRVFLTGQVPAGQDPQVGELRIVPGVGVASTQASGGEHLSSSEVSSLPLNARDFS